MRKVHRQFYEHQSNRSGVTWVDVTVAVVLTLVMAAVFLPAMTYATPARRWIECQNNMKQIALALENYSSRHAGQVPYLYEKITLEKDQVVRIPWTIKLLADLDNNALKRNYEADLLKFQNGKPISLKEFECPNDPNKHKVPGSLSYVANTGYIRADIFGRMAQGFRFAHSTLAIDWNLDKIVDAKDAQIAHATGVFWPHPSDRPANVEYVDSFRMTLDYIAAGDGQSNTLVFAENLQARNWHRADEMHDLAFGVPVVAERDFPEELKNRRLAFGLGLEKLLRAKHALPNEDPKAKPGTVPRPSSVHLGCCMYGFADGSAKQISDDIDWSVYVKLITPNGQRFGQSIKGLENF